MMVAETKANAKGRGQEDGEALAVVKAAEAEVARLQARIEELERALAKQAR